MRHPDTLAIAVALALVLGTAMSALSATPTRPEVAPKAGSAGRPRDRYAVLIKQVEVIYGKPLTDAQKKGVIAAAQERQRASKLAQERFRGSVAKALGLSAEQLTAKEKATLRARSQPRVSKP